MINIFKLFIPNFCLRLARNYDLTGKFQNFFSPYNLVYAQNHSIEIFEDTKISPLVIDKIYEQETTLFSRKYLNPGDCVYDVGANIGYFTLEFARSVGKDGKVLSFEPHPEIFEVLKRNIKRNRYSNIITQNVACGEINESKKLYFSSENEGNHKIVESKNTKGSVEVEIVRLSNFIKKAPPRLIKMDIEGAELLALKGINKDLLLKNDIDFIIEYHPYEMSFFNIEGPELLNWFTRNGYKFRNLATHEFSKISQSEVINNYKKEHCGITNIFCSKSIE